MDFIILTTTIGYIGHLSKTIVINDEFYINGKLIEQTIKHDVGVVLFKFSEYRINDRVDVCVNMDGQIVGVKLSYL